MGRFGRYKIMETVLLPKINVKILIFPIKENCPMKKLISFRGGGGGNMKSPDKAERPFSVRGVQIGQHTLCQLKAFHKGFNDSLLQV